MALGMEVGLGPGHIVLDGCQLPPPKRAQTQNPTIFGPFSLSQASGCIKMPLGMEVGLSPGDFVLNGDPAPPKKGAEPPIFGLRLLWPNGCIDQVDQDATWYGGRPP